MAGNKTPRTRRKTRVDGWNADCRTAFIEALSLCGDVTYSVKLVRKSRCTAYQLKKRDPAFSAAWDDAIGESMDDLFALLLHRAKHGSLRTTTDEGGKVRTVHSFSDAIGLQMLRHYRPTLHSQVLAARRSATPPAVEVDVCREVSRIIHEAG